ncbi:hypothetical protein [Rhizobium sp. KDH_Rht_773_N]
MIDKETLKNWLHRDLSSREKLLLILGSFDAPGKLDEIRNRAVEAGFRIPKKWNLSDILGRSGGLALRMPTGWELSQSGKAHLQAMGIVSASPGVVRIAVDLRAHLEKIKNQTTRAFVEEAINCYEAGLHRSAIVMSWIAAVDVLYHEVVTHHLAAFNKEAKSVNAKWKDAVNADGLTRMGESDFLERLVPIGVIGKNVKDELQKALRLRNGCGHPNSLKTGPNMVASHIESLLLNVFETFTT